MQKFKKGMYVRCPIDREDVFNPRLFILGQIIKVDYESHEVVVKFYEFTNFHEYFDHVPEIDIFPMDVIEHCRIIENSKVKIVGEDNLGEIIYCCNNDDNNYYKYYIRSYQEGQNKIEVIGEDDLKAEFISDNPNPLNQMKNYELQNPIWYHNRRIVSESLYTLRNATYGFETLVGSRAFLFSHQVDTIIRAIREPQCRFMLADEVGLGKTIEACVIMQGLKNRFNNLKTLIIVPDSLVKQWQNELYYKFWLDIPIWDSEKSASELKTDNLIIPLELINTYIGKGILELDWDLCITDETHRLLNMEEEYELIYSLSKRLKHMLLLTATPIQQRRDEYLGLLSLLMPERYGQMCKVEFNELLNKQEIIRSSVHWMIRDLDCYYEDELEKDYREELYYLASEVNDSVFNELIKEVEKVSHKEKLDKIKLVLSYISKYYQVEKKIIRHRRLEIEDELPDRNCEIYSYLPAGANYNFYELEVYQHLINYLSNFLQGSSNLITAGEFIKLFLSSMFSSPWALQSLLNLRKDLINKDERKEQCELKEIAATQEAEEQDFLSKVKNTAELKKHINENSEKLSEIEGIISKIKPLTGELGELEVLLDLNDLWLKAVKDEFSRLEELYNDPSLIKGRLLKVIDYLTENAIDKDKFVIFTFWLETLEKMEKVLSQRFGKEAVASFYQNKDKDELQEAVDKFQGNSQCQFLLCDELGGEGRNFQIAEAILHIDLPWSPMKLEQRIGRLDRIGRSEGNEVTSVVFFAEETVEEDLFKLWDKGLNIFNESISGMEIVIEEIYDEILEALASDLKYGLDEAFENISQKTEKMREVIEEERYFDIAQQLDYRIERQLKTLIDKFDEHGGQRLFETMMAWSNLTGLNAEEIDLEKKLVLFKPYKTSIASMENTLFVPPDMKETHKHLTRSHELRGTFSRELAVEREGLIFYAPGEPFFDAIVNNAQSCARGRCTAFAKKTDFEWQGFIFTWSPEIDIKPLLEIDEDIMNLIFIQGYLPVEQLITFEPLSSKYEDIDSQLLREELEEKYRNNRYNYSHLGKRGGNKDFLGIEGSNLQWFKSQIEIKKWKEILEESCAISKKKVNIRLNKMIDLEEAKFDLKEYLNGVKASNLYYEKRVEKTTEERLNKVFDALHQGLKEPKIKLDSLAFAWMRDQQ